MSAAADCVFCAIVAGTIPADVVSRSEEIVVFRDIAPAAPVHLVAVPTRHVRDVSALSADDAGLLYALVAAARTAAAHEDLAERGYRLVFNIGEDAGNTVPHLHLHVLGGRALSWPPG